jgi:hypothetical protein
VALLVLAGSCMYRQDVIVARIQRELGEAGM